MRLASTYDLQFELSQLCFFNRSVGRVLAPKAVNSQWMHVSLHQVLFMHFVVGPGVRSQVDCTAQLKVSTAAGGQDGLFVVMDGGRSPDAPEALKKMLESVLLEELAEDQKELQAGFQNPDQLQYLVHTFLTVHRLVCLSVCLSVCPSVCLFVCLSVHLSVCLLHHFK